MVNTQSSNIPPRSSSNMMQLQQPSGIIYTQAPSPSPSPSSAATAAARSGGMEAKIPCARWKCIEHQIMLYHVTYNKMGQTIINRRVSYATMFGNVFLAEKINGTT